MTRSFHHLSLQNVYFLRFPLYVAEKLVHEGVEEVRGERVSVFALKEVPMLKLLLRATDQVLYLRVYFPPFKFHPFQK